MIRHIVCWKLDENNKSENIKIMRERLSALVGKIDGLVKIEVGECYMGAWDAVLNSEFETKEALESYRTHPEHVKVADFIHTIMVERTAADYEI